jgi:electron transport complex protein RnfB
MQEILLPVAILAAAGLVCGLALALASRFIGVREDPRVADILALLPGANCGGCGFAGCAAYAAAVASGKAPPDRCTAGADAAKVADAAGIAAPEAAPEPLKAVVLCSGTDSFAKKSFVYDGLADCAAAAAVAGGDKTCPFGCLGYGSCVRVCPEGAITVENGVAHVDPSRCIGCGRCAAACPRHVIEMLPASRMVHVFCKSTDKGAVKRKYCSAGCIGCRLCERKAPGAVKVDGFLARVNYDVPFPLGTATDDCPVKCLRSAGQ